MEVFCLLSVFVLLSSILCSRCALSLFSVDSLLLLMYAGPDSAQRPREPAVWAFEIVSDVTRRWVCKWGGCTLAVVVRLRALESWGTFQQRPEG